MRITIRFSRFRELVRPGCASELDALDIDVRYVIIEGHGSARIGSGEAT
jgi:hypothetical protein